MSDRLYAFTGRPVTEEEFSILKKDVIEYRNFHRLWKLEDNRVEIMFKSFWSEGYEVSDFLDFIDKPEVKALELKWNVNTCQDYFLVCDNPEQYADDNDYKAFHKLYSREDINLLGDDFEPFDLEKEKEKWAEISKMCPIVVERAEPRVFKIEPDDNLPGAEFEKLPEIKIHLGENGEFKGISAGDSPMTGPIYNDDGILIGMQTGDNFIPVEYKEPTKEEEERFETIKTFHRLLNKVFFGEEM